MDNDVNFQLRDAIFFLIRGVFVFESYIISWSLANGV